MCKKWCSDTEYALYDESRVLDGLQSLSRCLFKHFHLVEDDDEYVRSAFVNDISYMCTTWLSRLNNVIPHKVLQNEKFFKFILWFDR